jgi:putative ABC transport system permease protein
VAVPLKYNLRNLRVRWITSALTAAGIGLVTLIFIFNVAMGLGIERSLMGSGHPMNLIAVRTGATAESQSIVTKKQVEDVISLPGIEKDAKGEPLVSAELIVIANLNKIDGKRANVALRGVGPKARDLRGNIRLQPGGRWFDPGLGELVVGVGAAGRFQNLKVGDTPFIRGRAWKVVGEFSAEGQAFESEVWGDIDDLKAQFKRDYSAILVRCSSAGEIERLSRVIKDTKEIALDAKPHTEYFKDQNQAAEMMKAMGGMMAFVLSIGAVFGAANTMYAAVAQRTREIATMRVLGFTRTEIWLSFIAESAFIGLVGGTAGAALGFVALNGMRAGTVNWVTFSDMAFRLAVTPDLAAGAVLMAALVGVAGGFFPAWRASRVPIARALRGL